MPDIQFAKGEGRGNYKDALVKHAAEIECFIGQMGDQVPTDFSHVVLLHMSFACCSLIELYNICRAMGGMIPHTSGCIPCVVTGGGKGLCSAGNAGK